MEHHSGFTLIELLVTVAVASALLVLATASMRAVLQNNRISAQATELSGSLNLARSEALKQQRIVYLSALDASSPGNELGRGWQVWVDGPNGVAGVRHPSEPALARTDALQDGSIIDASPDTQQVFFRPDGTTGTPVTFALRVPDCRGDEAGRNVSVAAVGRIRVTRVGCP